MVDISSQYQKPVLGVQRAGFLAFIFKVIFKFLFLCIFFCMCVQMCADVHRCSQRTEEDIGASETEVRSSREPLSVGAGNGTQTGNPGCVVGLMCGNCGLKADR